MGTRRLSYSRVTANYELIGCCEHWSHCQIPSPTLLFLADCNKSSFGFGSLGRSDQKGFLRREIEAELARTSEILDEIETGA